MAKSNSKFCEGSRANARRAVVLSEIKDRMISPPVGGDATQIKQRTGGGRNFSELQDRSTQDALIRRRAPSLAYDEREAS